MSNMQRSMKLFRDQGYEVDIVEKYNSFAGVRIDLFNILDILAMKPGVGFVGIQTTSLGCIPEHIKKIKAEPRAKTWLACGGRIMLHGWYKKKIPGIRQQWHVKAIEITI